ncbi:MAG: methyltransferase domain-containing protein [Gammaproteobacteria bacterium]|nr:MAG: methyltransferase domain-containing protein [Gammaproteobacteria bacterium]
MSAENNQPDWDNIAEKFDMWLPHLAPVGDALVEKLGASPGDYIIDLASGTGEPALSLARRFNGTISVVGVDAAGGMVRAASSKVKTENIPEIEFREMAAEKLEFDDAVFDRALCRFGVMLFEDPLKGLKEMRRVLKPGGRFSLAVWNTPETMLTLCWACKVFKGRIPEDQYPPMAKVTSLSGPGVLNDLLNKAGFSDFSVEKHTFNYSFNSFDDYWDTVEASDILKQQYDALATEERDSIRDEAGQLAKDFVQEGRLIIPHEYLLASGNK